MTDFIIEPNWQEDESPTHRKLKALREATPGLPCETCEGRTACGISGHECREFKRWVKSGTT